MKGIGTFLLVTALTSGTAGAEGEEPGEPSYNVVVDGTVVLAGATAWLASEHLFDLRAAHCRWCDQPLNSIDSSAREALRWSDPDLAHRASNVSAFVITPVSIVAASVVAAVDAGDPDEFLEDGLIVLQATTLGAVLHQVVKLSVAREQPYVRSATQEERARRGIRNRFTSFYSGHTSGAFTLAVAAGTLASMRHYRGQGYVWGVGLGAAATTGYLRLAADRHYLTDVLVGAAVGSAVGFVVPYYLHRPADQPPASSTSAPLLLGTSFVW